MGFECLQRGRFHNIPGQPFLVLCHPQCSSSYWGGTPCILVYGYCFLSCHWTPPRRVWHHPWHLPLRYLYALMRSDEMLTDLLLFQFLWSLARCWNTGCVGRLKSLSPEVSKMWLIKAFSNLIHRQYCPSFEQKGELGDLLSHFEPEWFLTSVSASLSGNTWWIQKNCFMLRAELFRKTRWTWLRCKLGMREKTRRNK